MLYCEKCRGICEDATLKCPNCRSAKLREVTGEDMIRLHRADQYTAQRLVEQFDAAGVVYEAEPFSTGHVSYLYDSEVMPTDKNIFVRYSDLETAKGVSAKMQETLERERQEEKEETEEQFEDMPRRKRLIVQTLSIIAFLICVMLAVFAADALAGWLKSALHL